MRTFFATFWQQKVALKLPPLLLRLVPLHLTAYSAEAASAAKAESGADPRPLDRPTGTPRLFLRSAGGSLRLERSSELKDRGL